MSTPSRPPGQSTSAIRSPSVIAMANPCPVGVAPAYTRANVSPEIMAFRVEYAGLQREAANHAAGTPTGSTDGPPVDLSETMPDIVNHGILHGHDDTEQDTTHQHYSMYSYAVYIYIYVYICLHMYTYVCIRNMYIYIYIHIHTYTHMIVLIHIR